MPILAGTSSSSASGQPLVLGPLDTCSFGGVTFGRTDSNGVEWYFLDIDGWGSPQSTVSAVQKTGADGAYATPAFLQPRTVTTKLALFAPSRPALLVAKDALTAAAGLSKQPLTVVEAGQSRYINAYRQGEIMFKETSDVSTEIAIQWLCPDPRKYDSASLTATTGLPSTTGGLSVPFTVPFSINSTVVSGNVFLTNPGNADGTVKYHITGPLVAPQVIHVDAAGNTLTWASSITLSAADYLDVSMKARTVVINNSAPRDQYTTTRDWALFTPGVNEWAFSAQSGSGQLTVTATVART